VASLQPCKADRILSGAELNPSVGLDFEDLAAVRSTALGMVVAGADCCGIIFGISVECDENRSLS